MTDQVQPHEGFRELAAGWAEAACRQWGYPEVDDGWHAQIEQRLPLGLRTLIADGIGNGEVQVEGHRFRPIGLPDTKGPYAFLSVRLPSAPPQTGSTSSSSRRSFGSVHRPAVAG